MQTAYPESHTLRNRWILEKRGLKNRLDPFKPYAFLQEKEFGADGRLIPTATLFLTNKECPFRCLMCDLWQNTLDERVPSGAIAKQIRYALAQPEIASGRLADSLGRSERQIKLYNAGSFFDPQAIPPEDDEEIAETVAEFDRVIVECHPTFLGGERCLRFRDLLKGKLEVAVGLETAHPTVLDRINKRVTVETFQNTAEFLIQNDIDLRVFILLRPPFLSEEEGLEWAKKSLDVAFEAGAGCAVIIPTRGGNGAMEVLQEAGDFTPPSIISLEKAQEYGIGLGQGRVFSDLWDIEKTFRCECAPLRAARLDHMNLTQQIPPPVECTYCSGEADAR